MGLDTVELIMAVEDTFSIAIPDKDASNFTTVGHLYDYIRSRRGAASACQCPTASAFWRLRGAMTKTGIPRKLVRPAARLNDLFNGVDAHRQWRLVHRDLGMIASRRRPSASTVRSFIKDYLPAITPLPDAELWDRLCTVISHQLGVRKEDLRPELRWIEDLGAG